MKKNVFALRGSEVGVYKRGKPKLLVWECKSFRLLVMQDKNCSKLKESVFHGISFVFYLI